MAVRGARAGGGESTRDSNDETKLPQYLVSGVLTDHKILIHTRPRTPGNC